MSKLKVPVISLSVDRGGSEWGLSYYKGLAYGCARRSLWAKAYVSSLSEEEQLLYYQAFMLSDSATNRGVMGHALLEKLFLGEYENPHEAEFIWEHEVHKKRWLDAVRCVKAWYHMFGGRLALGRPMYVEENIEMPKAKCKKLLHGLKPSTGIMDLVSGVDKYDIDCLRGLENPEKKDKVASVLVDPTNSLRPGNWISDHKFHSMETGTAFEEALNNPAYYTYPLTWNNICDSNEKVLGSLQNTIYCTKDPRFKVYVIPFGDQDSEQAKRFKAFVAREQYLATMGDKLVNTDACIQYGRECYYKTSGMCKGY